MEPGMMKVAELRAELKSRGLPAVGKKAELAAALAAALASDGGNAAAAAASTEAPDIDSLVESAFAVFEHGLGNQSAQAMKLGGDAPRVKHDAKNKVAIERLDKAEIEDIMSRTVLDGIERPAEELGRREKPAGPPGFFDFRSTELTEDVRHDLEVIKMRTFINPKKHYKGQDHKWAPEKFQVGTVIVPAHEFYSAGMGKKELRRGALEGFKRDTTTNSYIKRKFLEVQEKKNSGGKKQYKAKIKKRRPKYART